MLLLQPRAGLDSALPRWMRCGLVAVVAVGMACGGPSTRRTADRGAGPGLAFEDGAGTDGVGGGFDSEVEVDAGVFDLGPDAEDAGPGAAGAGGQRCGGAFDGEVTLTHQGRERHALVYVPASAAGGAAPLVVSLHGFSGDPEEHRDTTHFRELAQARGFIVAFPSGVGRSWNGGACCGPANLLGVDDVGFLKALIAQLSRDFCVDAKRIHLSGFSNGGFMAHRMACEAADVVASVGVVAGQMALGTCTPSRPVAVAQLHGTADPVVPFSGNPVLGFPATLTTLGGWAARDGCLRASREDDGGVRLLGWTECAGGVEVRLVVVVGGGHDWFGGGTRWDGGGPVNATLTLLDFFAAHPLP